ncbi:hypothetical protein ABIC60_002991 [Phyllobacterium ifriqiyense]
MGCKLVANLARSDSLRSNHLPHGELVEPRTALIAKFMLSYPELVEGQTTHSTTANIWQTTDYLL